MKRSALILAVLFTQIIIAQKKTYSGYIINKETKEPISGAAILLRGRVITFSNLLGKFEFTSKKKKKEYVKITHLSYETDSILLKKISRKNVKIGLVEKFTSLDEVVVTASLELSKKEIIKRATKKFDLSKRKGPYWSSVNYKQSFIHKGVAQGYYEMDGHAFMIGEDNYIFRLPILIQNQIRRTTENEEMANLLAWHKSNKLLKHGHDKARGSLLNFRCTEVIHPLNKRKNKFFEFKIEKTEEIDGKEYYVIQFKQKRKIYVKRKIFKTSGKLWVDKEDFMLLKSNIGFDFDNITYSNLKIKYLTNNDIVYPSEIYSETYHYTNPRGQDISNLITKGLMTFNKIDFKQREDYHKMYPYYMLGFLTANVYNKGYWSNKPINSNLFKRDIMDIVGSGTLETNFMLGAKEKQYEKKSATAKVLEMYKQRNLELLKKMKKDLNIKD
jgi:hypothetical protein